MDNEQRTSREITIVLASFTGAPRDHQVTILGDADVEYDPGDNLLRILRVTGEEIACWQSVIAWHDQEAVRIESTAK